MFSVIVPSKNAANIDACVTALRRAGEAARVLVIDGGCEWRRPDCEYLPGVEPFVYARAINQGLAAAGSDDVIICGDDTRLRTEHGYHRLLFQARKNPDYAAISAGITDAVGNPRQLWRGRIPLIDEPTMLCFVAVAITRAAIDRVGGLDERYTDYGCDDGDWCYAARRAGFRLGISDVCHVEHGVLPSEFRKAGPRPYNANARRFEEKWGVPYGS